MVWEKGYGKSFVADVGGVGYNVTDYSGCMGETGARKWEATVYFTHQAAGSPKQSRFIANGFDTFKDTKVACADDMRERAAELLMAANE